MTSKNLCVAWRYTIMQDKAKFRPFHPTHKSYTEMFRLWTHDNALLKFPFFQLSFLTTGASAVTSRRFRCKKHGNFHSLWQNYICNSNAPFLHTPASLPSLPVLDPDNTMTPITCESSSQPNWAWRRYRPSRTTRAEELLMRESHRSQHDKPWTQHLNFFLSFFLCLRGAATTPKKEMPGIEEGRRRDECARRMF